MRAIALTLLILPLSLTAPGCADLRAVGSADYLAAKAVKAEMDAGWWTSTSTLVWRGGW